MTHHYFKPGLFSGKRVVITGAGRGIGAAIAEHLSADGAQVFAHLGREQSGARWTFPGAEPADSIHTATADLATIEGIDTLADKIQQQFEQIDVLINNAGTMLGRVGMEQMSAEHYASVTDLNARSVVLLTTRLLPQLKASGDASIINVSSISADTGGSAGSSIYSAAKGFISTYTKSLATELAPDNIRVNAISPGTIDTDFHQRYSSAEKLAATASKTPLGRLGTAEDCVPACLFLASAQLSGFITGQIIGINGGTSYA